MEPAKGFLGALFDFSFTEFITPKLIKVLYGLSIAGAGLVALLLIGSAFRVSAAGGLLMLLIGAPLLFLVWVIYTRLLLEMIIIIFRISEHTAQIAEQGRKGIAP